MFVCVGDSVFSKLMNLDTSHENSDVSVVTGQIDQDDIVKESETVRVVTDIHPRHTQNICVCYKLSMKN